MGDTNEARFYFKSNIFNFFSCLLWCEKRSQEMARLLKSYNRLKKTRTLTEADEDIFSKRVIGFDSKRVKKASRPIIKTELCLLYLKDIF